jgi:nitrite reductase (NADH) small subunit
VTWLQVATLDELVKRRKLVVDHDGASILVLAHDGEVYAFDNICIHKQRELAKGVVLNGKLVCPGHQWAFSLDRGWEAVKEQFQPTYDVRVDDGVVWVDTASRAECAGTER